MSSRNMMIAELKSVVVPLLLTDGFKGTFPNFRRLRKATTDLISFQFDKYGGGFIIEIAQCSVDGYTNRWRKHTSANKMTTWKIEPSERLRLQPLRGPSRKNWFRYDNAQFRETAQSVLPFLEEAELWWHAAKAEQARMIHSNLPKRGIWSRFCLWLRRAW